MVINNNVKQMGLLQSDHNKQLWSHWAAFFFFFFLDFGLSRLSSLLFIQYHIAGIYKPTIPQSPPSHFAGLQHMQQCQVRVYTQILIQMNGAWKMVFTVRVWTQVMSLLP